MDPQQSKLPQKSNFLSIIPMRPSLLLASLLLAASLPAEVMLAALVDRLGHDEWRLRFRNGSATRETDDFEDIARWMQRGDVVEARRVLPAQSTPWEVAP